MGNYEIHIGKDQWKRDAEETNRVVRISKLDVSEATRARWDSTVSKHLRDDEYLFRSFAEVFRGEKKKHTEDSPEIFFRGVEKPTVLKFTFPSVDALIFK